MFVLLFYQVFIFNNWVFFVLGNMSHCISLFFLLQHFVLDCLLIYISLCTITILGLAVGTAVEVPFAEKPELSVSNVLSLMRAADQNVTML